MKKFALLNVAVSWLLFIFIGISSLCVASAISYMNFKEEGMTVATTVQIASSIFIFLIFYPQICSFIRKSNLWKFIRIGLFSIIYLLRTAIIFLWCLLFIDQAQTMIKICRFLQSSIYYALPQFPVNSKLSQKILSAIDSEDYYFLNSTIIAENRFLKTDYFTDKYLPLVMSKVQKDWSREQNKFMDTLFVDCFNFRMLFNSDSIVTFYEKSLQKNFNISQMSDFYSDAIRSYGRLYPHIARNYYIASSKLLANTPYKYRIEGDYALTNAAESKTYESYRKFFESVEKNIQIPEYIQTYLQKNCSVDSLQKGVYEPFFKSCRPSEIMQPFADRSSLQINGVEFGSAVFKDLKIILWGGSSSLGLFNYLLNVSNKVSSSFAVLPIVSAETSMKSLAKKKAKIFSGLSEKYGFDPVLEKEPFSYLNTDFVKWAERNLIPQPDSTILDVSYKNIYSTLFSNIFRNFVLSEIYIERYVNDMDVCEILYKQAVNTENTMMFLEDNFSMANNKTGRNDCSSDFELYCGFWIRRTIDGSRETLKNALESIMTKYDMEWYLTREELWDPHFNAPINKLIETWQAENIEINNSD